MVTGPRSLLLMLLLLEACGRVAYDESPRDAQVLGDSQSGEPFEVVWGFSDDADYLFDPAHITLADGAARLERLGTVDDGPTALGFGGGTFLDTIWNPATEAVELTTGASTGEFVSRVFDLGAEQTWTGLRWAPEARYGANLPDNGGPGADSTDGVSMVDNRLLLHLDAPAMAEASTIIDASGNDAHGTLATGDTDTKATGGVLRGAFHSDGVDDSITIPAGTAVDELTFGAGATATWAFWLKRDDTRSGTIMYKSDNNGARGWWIDIRAATDDIGIAFICPMGNTRKYTPDLPPPGQWFHFAITFTGGANGPPSAFHFYIDGVETSNFSQADGCNGGHASDAAQPLYLSSGGAGAGTFLAGTLDEVAIWGRALAPDEVQDLYDRGARRLGLQVRTCTTATCSDNPAFVGPAERPDAFFTSTDSISPATANFDVPRRARFAQYRMELESPPAAASPRVSEVGLMVGRRHVIGSARGAAYATLDGFVVDVPLDSRGDISFQLSPDGERWFHWADGAWRPASTETETSAAEVSAHIAEFSEAVGAGQLYFRATLTSDGTQPVGLDRIVARGRRP